MASAHGPRDRGDRVPDGDEPERRPVAGLDQGEARRARSTSSPARPTSATGRRRSSRRSSPRRSASRTTGSRTTTRTPTRRPSAPARSRRARRSSRARRSRRPPSASASRSSRSPARSSRSTRPTSRSSTARCSPRARRRRRSRVPDVAAAATWTYGELITGTGAQLKPYATIVDPETGQVDLPPHSAISYAACAAEVEVDDETGVVTGDAARAGATTSAARSTRRSSRARSRAAPCRGSGSACSRTATRTTPRSSTAAASSARTSRPGFEDLPQIDTIIIENPSADGPYGAKGIGEMANNAQPPAIAAAVFDAVGVWVTELPITPERVLRALEAKAGADARRQDGRVRRRALRQRRRAGRDRLRGPGVA